MVDGDGDDSRHDEKFSSRETSSCGPTLPVDGWEARISYYAKYPPLPPLPLASIDPVVLRSPLSDGMSTEEEEVKTPYDILEKKYKKSLRDLRQINQVLDIALESVDDARSTISKLEGLVGSLKGVIVHLDPIQGGHILTNEIAAMEAALFGIVGGSNINPAIAGRGNNTTSIEVANGNSQGTNQAKAAHVQSREDAEFQESKVESRSREQATTAENTRRDTRIATISHNKSKQESMIEEAIRHKREQQEAAASSNIWSGVFGHLRGQVSTDATAQSSTTTSAAKDENFEAAVERMEHEIKKNQGPTALRLAPKVFTPRDSSVGFQQDPRVSTISHHPSDQEIMIRNLLKKKELEKMNQTRSIKAPVKRSSRPAPPPTEVAPTSKRKQDPRIKTISHHPSDQELMIEKALEKKRKEKSTTMVKSTQQPSAEKLRDNPPSSDGKVPERAGPRKQSLEALGDVLSPEGRGSSKKQDPRIKTISHFPSDHDIMLIQKALEKEQQVQTTKAFRQSVDGEIQGKTVVNGDSNKQKNTLESLGVPSNLALPKLDNLKKQDPRIKTISHFPSEQELIIQRALAKKQQEKTTKGVGNIQGEADPVIEEVRTTSKAPRQESLRVSSVIQSTKHGNPKQQDTRIKTISHFLSEQELMVRNVVQNAKSTTSEEARVCPSHSDTPNEGGQTVNKSAPDKIKPAYILPVDARVATISHNPSDQELIIQAALKKKQSEARAASSISSMLPSFLSSLIEGPAESPKESEVPAALQTKIPSTLQPGVPPTPQTEVLRIPDLETSAPAQSEASATQELETPAAPPTTQLEVQATLEPEAPPTSQPQFLGNPPAPKLPEVEVNPEPEAPEFSRAKVKATYKPAEVSPSIQPENPPTPASEELEVEGNPGLEVGVISQAEVKATYEPETPTSLQPGSRATHEPESPEFQDNPEPQAPASLQPEVAPTPVPEALAPLQRKISATPESEALSAPQPESLAALQPEIAAQVPASFQVTPAPNPAEPTTPESDAPATSQPEVSAAFQLETPTTSQREASLTPGAEALATPHPEVPVTTFVGGENDESSMKQRRRPKRRSRPDAKPANDVPPTESPPAPQQEESQLLVSDEPKKKCDKDQLPVVQAEETPVVQADPRIRTFAHQSAQDAMLQAALKRKEAEQANSSWSFW